MGWPQDVTRVVIQRISNIVVAGVGFGLILSIDVVDESPLLSVTP